MSTKFSSRFVAVAAAIAAIGVGNLSHAGKPAGAKKDAGRQVEMKVTDNGFEPAKVEVKKGQPATLAITRTTDATCATEILIDGTDVNQKLPLNETVRVTFTPKKSGELKYGCAMGKMLGGVLLVK